LVTKRRPRQEFVPEPVTHSKNSICQPCYERNIESKLVEYKPDPEHFMICPYCNNIVNKRIMRFQSLPEPLGSRAGKAEFQVVETSKRRKTRVNRGNETEVFNVNDYKLPNGEIDKDLIHYASQGLIVSVNDENVDVEQY
jgi:hypothetical protein